MGDVFTCDLLCVNIEDSTLWPVSVVIVAAKTSDSAITKLHVLG